MQTIKNSIFESVANVVAGLITSFLIQIFIYKWLNITVTTTQNVKITIVFFIFSFVRGYIIRRIFNKIKT